MKATDFVVRHSKHGMLIQKHESKIHTSHMTELFYVSETCTVRFECSRIPSLV